jgi:fructoselysine transporter
VLILCIAMSSLFAVVLGYSRVPYAAAVHGNFFSVFGKLHPKRNFPYVSLLVLCGLGLVLSMFMKLKDVITAILAMRIVVQFIAQAVGVVLLRRRTGTKHLPFKMWLYPLPVIISVILWIFLLYHNEFALYGGIIAMVGIGIYFVKKAIVKN